MKYLLIGILLIWGISCKQDMQKLASKSDVNLIPQIFILKSANGIIIKNDIVYWRDTAFSGFLYEINPENKDTLLWEGYRDGQLQGDCKKWYPNKQLMEERHYLAGEKNGTQRAYWPNGNKRFEFTAVKDICEGEMKEWTIDGRLFHLAHFVKGQEEGVQKLWYENGKIRANYVIINGKRYGLLGTKNCKNVSDSIFIVK